MGMTDKQMWEITQHDPWYATLNMSIWVEKSDIHGVGLFVDVLYKGDSLPASIMGKKMVPGRFVNHSPDPNCVVVIDDDVVLFTAIRDIFNEEVTINYRYTPGAEAWKRQVN
jgi:hypothetical protein